MAFGSWINEVVKETHPRGYDYYWMTGSYRNDEPDATDTDRYALDNGYIAVTPSLMDVTAYDTMELLSKRLDIKPTTR